MSITWAMAKNQYEKGTLQSEHPRVKDALDKASFNATKVTLLVLVTLCTLAATVGLVFFCINVESLPRSLENLEMVMGSITVFLGLIVGGGAMMGCMISDVIDHKNKIEEDKQYQEQPYLKSLLSQPQDAPKEMQPKKMPGGEVCL